MHEVIEKLINVKRFIVSADLVKYDELLPIIEELKTVLNKDANEAQKEVSDPAPAVEETTVEPEETAKEEETKPQETVVEEPAKETHESDKKAEDVREPMEEKHEYQIVIKKDREEQKVLVIQEGFYRDLLENADRVPNIINLDIRNGV
jgi:hypothetical protein